MTEQCPFCNSLDTIRIEDKDNFPCYKCNECSKNYGIKMVF